VSTPAVHRLRRRFERLFDLCQAQRLQLPPPGTAAARIAPFSAHGFNVDVLPSFDWRNLAAALVMLA